MRRYIRWNCLRGVLGASGMKIAVAIIVLFVVLPLFIARCLAVGGGDRDE